MLLKKRKLLNVEKISIKSILCAALLIKLIFDNKQYED
jgi:hypothetical protein